MSVIIEAHEMSDALPMYDDSTRYVDGLAVNPAAICGHYRIKRKDVFSHFSRDEIDAIVGVTLGATLKVTEQHTRGHFTPETGISVFPGHKIVAAAAEKATDHAILTRLTRIDGPVEFKVPVLPGDSLQFMEEDGTVLVKLGNIEVASVSGLRFVERDLQKPVGMGLDRLIEAAAQCLGLAFIRSRDIREVLPLFGGVRGPVDYPREVHPGELLEMTAVVTSEQGTRQFSGNVGFQVDGEEVASVQGIECRLFPSSGMGRLIRMGRSKLS